jgi:hypothetical protein
MWLLSSNIRLTGKGCSEMKGMHNYIFSIFAGCCIALGTGFLTVPQYVLDYEKEAIKLAFDIEQVEGIVFKDSEGNPNIRGILNKDCTKLKTKTRDCKYVKYTFEQSKEYLDLNESLFYLIVVTLSATLIVEGWAIRKYLTRNLISK